MQDVLAPDIHELKADLTALKEHIVREFAHQRETNAGSLQAMEDRLTSLIKTTFLERRNADLEAELADAKRKLEAVRRSRKVKLAWLPRHSE